MYLRPGTDMTWFQGCVKYMRLLLGTMHPGSHSDLRAERKVHTSAIERGFRVWDSTWDVHNVWAQIEMTSPSESGAIFCNEKSSEPCCKLKATQTAGVQTQQRILRLIIILS